MVPTHLPTLFPTSPPSSVPSSAPTSGPSRAPSSMPSDVQECSTLLARLQSVAGDYSTNSEAENHASEINSMTCINNLFDEGELADIPITNTVFYDNEA